MGLGFQDAGTVSGVIFDEEDDPVNSDLVTKKDLENVETKLERRIDGVEDKLDIVARQVGVLTERVDALTERVDALTGRVDALTGRVDALTERVDSITATMATRADLAALREEMNRDIAQHMKAGFEMMRQLFQVQDDRARSIEEKYDALRHDFTAHTRDFALHCKP